MIIMNKWLKRYEDWSKQPLNYNFNRTFFFISVIYFVCTFFDFCFTYVTFRLDSDSFFMYEISFIIKRAFGGDPFFCMLLVVFFMLPLIVTYGVDVYLVRKCGMQVNGIRVVLFAVWLVCFLHVVGGLTNFFYLIGME